MNYLDKILEHGNEVQGTRSEISEHGEISEVKKDNVFAEFDFDIDDFQKKSDDFYIKSAQAAMENFTERTMLYENATDELLKARIETNDDRYYLERSPINGRPSGLNCYGYAIGVYLDPTTDSAFLIKPMPGMLAGAGHFDDIDSVISTGDIQMQKEFFTEKMSADAEAMGMGMKIDPVDKDYQPQEGEHLIALATTGYSPAGCDFHFYRKGDSGVWSHKPGLGKVINVDVDGQMIFDPETCNRGIYKDFIGYFVVRR